LTTIKLDIVTAERLVFSDDVDMVIASGVEGQLGILPKHAPLMTMLNPGELRVKQGGNDFSLVVSGGFLEVRPDRIIILADAAERAEEINIARAEEAKKRAQQRLSMSVSEMDATRAEGALRRSLARLAVAQASRRRKRSS
jgi:F-type H+-transporting ATPase subunit epsilon